PARMQLLLHLGAVHSRHVEIQQYTVGLFRADPVEKIAARSECLHTPAEGQDQHPYRATHRFIVIDDENGGRDVLAHGFLSWLDSGCDPVASSSDTGAARYVHRIVHAADWTSVTSAAY